MRRFRVKKKIVRSRARDVTRSAHDVLILTQTKRCLGTPIAEHRGKENNALKDGDKPIANPNVVLREEFDDWAILFNPDTGRGFGLNPTGVCVWKLLDGGHTIDGLLVEIRRHADNLPKDARDHIGAFIDPLVTEGLAAGDAT